MVGKYRKIGKFDKIKLMKNKYSKIRMFLVAVLFIFFGVFALIPFISDFQLNLPVVLFFIGSSLFAFNRKWSDYISFSIFVFGLVSSITYKIRHCLNSEFCGNAIYESLKFDKAETLFIFVSILIVAYLFTTFFRVKNT